MKEYTLVIASPDGDFFRGDAAMLSLRGTEGSLAILAGHVPFLTAVVPCDATIGFADGSEKTIELEGGLLTVSTDTVTLLSSGVRWKDEA